MRVTGRRRFGLALLALVAARPAFAQDLGHKVMGTLGLRAAEQPPPGLYVANQFLFWDSEKLFDRTGRMVPLGLSLQALADGVAIGAVYELHGTYLNAGIAVPVARVVGKVDRLEASIDRFGLSDVYVQPLQLGWRVPHLDLQIGYAFYIPTARYEPGGGFGDVSRGSWSHELSLGGTTFFDEERTLHFSAMASLELNEPKLGADLKRGSTVQLQGGVGKRLFDLVDVGMVGYALWQVTDDSGAALPPLLRGARDRVYGLGAEIDVTIREARASITLRYAHDLAAWSRPLGQILLVQLAFYAIPWQRHGARKGKP